MMSQSMSRFKSEQHDAFSRTNCALFAFFTLFCTFFACLLDEAKWIVYSKWILLAILGTYSTQGICMYGQWIGQKLTKRQKHKITPCRFVKQRRVRATRTRRVKRHLVQQMHFLIPAMIALCVFVQHFLPEIKLCMRTSMVYSDPIAPLACFDDTFCISIFAITHRNSRLIQEIIAQCLWHIAPKLANKLQHAINGNMDSHFMIGKGYGKAKKGKKGSMNAMTPEQKEQQFQQEMREALPIAALQRMAPMPLEEEWSVPVRPFTELSDAPGIAIVPKDQLPSVIRAVGYSCHSIAVLVTQHPSQIGLKGYPSNEIHCSIMVKQDDGENKIITVRRHLVQIGFGEPVQKIAVGAKIIVPEVMVKMVAKMPPYFGWTEDAIRGSTLSTHLAKICDLHAIEQILCRDNYSATFMAHESTWSKTF